MADENLGFLGNLKELIGESADLVGNIGRIQDGITNINRSFGESRERFLEFSIAVSDSVSDFVRLGGRASDVSDTIAKIGEGARRNVVASQESLQEIFATSRFLGESVEYLVEQFGVIGVELSNIGEGVEESVGYVQSLGLNAVSVMGDVLNKVDMMNRFNFQDGVVGFTKMAAQASMLRFDMQSTANFADKVLNPEGAIQMAAAFQRLGVATGDLVDPFILMDKSINDPQGLQDSLIEMTKQFTYFDEKTGNFRINPGGVRLMKELADTAGISFEQFSKTALAAADLDRRLGEISFDVQGSEEDKMLVANMAKMGEGGRYEVQFRDERGKLQTESLDKLTQSQFELIRKQAAERPETMEDIARKQLATDELIARDIAALPQRLGYAIAGQEGLQRAIERGRMEEERISGAAFAPGVLPSAEEFRKQFQNVGDEVGQSIVSLLKGQTTFEDVTQTLKGAIENESVNLNMAERYQNFLSKYQELTNQRDNMLVTRIGQQEDTRYPQWEEYQRTTRSMGGETITGKVDVVGEFNIKVDAPNTLTEQQVFTIFNNPEVKANIYKIVETQTTAAIKKLKNTN
jgi:hypothetical protein